ncbi:MAG: T9SS type A sorting domain-containing protein, partial [Ignavibacteriota bacterium]
NPMGVQTLLSSDAGKTWHAFLTDIPGEDTLSRVCGSLQAIQGTSEIYYFTGSAEGVRGYGHKYSIRDPDPMFGANFLYSTDYGATWEFQRDHGDNRRGFEAVGNKELWITARPSTSTNLPDAASDILHSFDNGNSWIKDSTTLHNDIIFDGRIISFSDPQHGWILATKVNPKSDGIIGNRTTVFRYDATEQIQNKIEELGARNAYQSLLKIFPNPASEVVKLQIASAKTIHRVEFYDLMGRRFYPEYEMQTNIATANIHSLPSGMYIARVIYLFMGQLNEFKLPFIVQRF